MTKPYILPSGIPRRVSALHYTPAEHDVRKLVAYIDRMEAHPSLTAAIVALNQAFEHVADYEDERLRRDPSMNDHRPEGP